MADNVRAELEELLLQAGDAGDEALMADIAGELDALDAEEAQAKKKLEFVNQLDLTPTEAPRRVAPPGTGAPRTGNPLVDDMAAMQRQAETINTPVTAENADEQYYIEQAAKAGVDVMSGLDPRTRALAGLVGGNGGDEDGSLLKAALSGLVSKSLHEQGVEIPEDEDPVQFDPVSGKLAYLRPLPNGKLKPTLVNPVGIDFGDALSALDVGTGIAIEGAATAGAGALAAPLGGVGAVVAGAAAGGATNATVNYARREMARAFGVPDELVDKIDSDYLLSEAIDTAGWELGGPLAFGTMKKIRNAYRPVDNDADTEGILKEIARVRKMAADLSQRTNTPLVRPLLGEATGDARIRAIEKDAEMGSLGPTSQKINQLRFENNANIVDAIKVIQERHVPIGTPAPTSEDRYTARQLMFNKREIAEQYEAATKKDLSALASSVTPQISGQDYMDVQAAARAGLESLRGKENEAWNNFRAQIEVDPETTRALVLLDNPSDSPINAAVKRIREQAASALSVSLKKAKESLINDLGFKEDAVPNDMLAGGALDMNHLHELLSHLKYNLRAVDRQAEPSGWKKEDLISLIKAIDDQMNTGQFLRMVDAPFGEGKAARPLGDSRTALVRDSYSVAREATNKKIDAFRQEAADKIFRTMHGKDPVFAAPELVRREVLTPADTTTLGNLMDVVDRSPDIRYALVRDLESQYRMQVFDEKGVPSKLAHEKFMSNYRPHLEMLIGRDQTDFITNAQNMARAVERAKQERKMIAEALNKQFGPRYDPRNEARDVSIVKDMLDGSLSVASIKAAKKAITSAGASGEALWASLQKEGLELRKGKFLKDGQKVGNLRALQEALDGPEAERLSALFGPEYVVDLKLARDILETIYEPEAARTRFEINTPAIKVFRSIFGPMDVIQRRITSLQSLSEALKKKRAADIIFSPDDLRKLVKFAKTPPGGFAQAQAAIGAGVNIADMPPELQVEVQKVTEMNQKRKNLGFTVDPVSEVQRINNAR